MQETLDPITTTGALFPLTFRPEHYAAMPDQPPTGVAFGYSQIEPIPDTDDGEYPNLTYCSQRQMLVMGDGVPAHTLPRLGDTVTTKTTPYDMTKVSEPDVDRTQAR